ncbi:RecQ family ATP-dependent DNA helicase [Aeromonas salmonicida subsp. achromogenes]|uniref:RecQ family ATP-dependent DNA helicase n=1 Tax=Aeromonas salmonicida TaxID=645 RepID=UPI000311E097|nr:RecQ family ATP-dependent DNA helicase [Aeromonas salmonicida]TMX10997.1 RecQ family ATP-dependent DNA helicase [Aeromonas salmonicida subsp. achromogenes]TMX11787.1 RecQ family ATP-dependent DNA helicase [Aeromonas salmonicida subsp. achromogenes]TMX14396.1 RecQ family ATP-dependent DNA helicase [Aeromonas salmonicida subsp. achromogenes]TMX18988.1 RecQ family ATP-dependent DNA helicase [Aeromonas salmonicida subsp. achromogenes]
MISSLLTRHFGLDQLRPGQETVISRLLAGQSAAAIFPTGSGKSLCYQLPALALPHLTLVISPLIALMHDQLAFLHSKGIPAATLDSSQTPEESRRVMQQASDGQLKILMISVERLKNERFRRFIQQVPLSMLVVDEAHCISEWGHNFRPDYLKLPAYRRELKIPQVLLLTATATPAVMADMQAKFDIEDEGLIVTGFYRANLDLAVVPQPAEARDNWLQAEVRREPTAPTIVYVTLQHTAQHCADLLQRAGIRARAYHAGLDSALRSQIQHDFMAGKVDCIVATIAFGMGIDKADIRRVIHYDLPKSIENYSQEIGRAGRDGLPSRCIVLANRAQLPVLENFVYGDTPDRAAIVALLEILSQSGSEWEFGLLRLSNDTNIRQLPLKTLLVYLEMAGIIMPAYSYFAEYRFKFVLDKAEILTRFNPDRRQFLEQLFACASQARSWCTMDFDALWQGYQGERHRAAAALDYLQQQGWIELESKQMTDVYRVLRQDVDINALADELYALFEKKELSELARLQALLAFFTSSHCLSQELARYFANEQAPSKCGHCSVCRGEVAVLPPLPTLTLPNENGLRAWCDPLIALCHTRHPRILTRFLCGIATPLTTRVKAKSLAGFGQLAAHPFAEVLAAVSRFYPTHNN